MVDVEDRGAASAPLDEVARDAVLAFLLREHADAYVAGIGPDGLFVPLPSSVELTGQRVVEARSALELVDTGSRQAVIEAWDLATTAGAGVAVVRLPSGSDAAYHFVDVRHRHGVLVGLLVCEDAAAVGASLVDRAPVPPRSGTMEKDQLAVIVAVDERLCAMLGYEAAELLGQRTLELIHPDDHVRAVDSWMELLSLPGGTHRLRARHRHRDGSWRWLELTNHHRLADQGTVLTEVIDISDEMAATEALRQREQLLGRLTEALPSGVLHVDLDRRVLYANARVHDVLGTGPAADLDDHLDNVTAEDRATMDGSVKLALVEGIDRDLEVRVHVADERRPRRCAVAIRALSDSGGLPAGAVLCIDDVTEASLLRSELERMATVDELTGCLNRRAVLASLAETLADHDGAGSGTAVVFIDLDGLKRVNDTEGHEAGDRLLVSAAARLRESLRDGDLLGRLGGDEFLVVLPRVVDRRGAVDRARELAGGLGGVGGGSTEPIRSSIGVVWAGAGHHRPDALIAAADRAMYASKRGGVGEIVTTVIANP